jgi:glycosyltransferase involved in cell wall biosynthesis
VKRLTTVGEMKLDISVILPVYLNTVSGDAVNFLDRALESIFEQRFPGEFEIIVVDDGSKVPVSDVVECGAGEFADRIRWLRSVSNQGLVHSLNLGLSAAKYPFIARLDADDCWISGKIEKQCRCFFKDTDLTIVATGMARRTTEGILIDRHVRPGDWNGILRFFSDVGCPFPHGSVLARKDVYRLLGGYPHDVAFRHCEDYALWGLWLRFFKPAMIEELLYDYTVSRESISIQHSEEQTHASGIICNRFTNLNLAERLPSALTELASCLGISVYQAGVLSLRMWRHQAPVRIPHTAFEPLSIILNDMEIRRIRAENDSTLSLREALYGFCGSEVALEVDDAALVAIATS